MKKTIIAVTSAALILTGCVNQAGMDYKGDEPFVISNFGTWQNSVGGAQFHMDGFNSSSKTIKYVLFDATFYNAVGDQVASTIGRKTTVHYHEVGPIAPKRGFSSNYEIGFYNRSAECAKLEMVEVEFMDGEKVKWSGAQLSDIFLFKGRTCRGIQEL